MIDMLGTLNILAILQIGVSGLCFLLSLLAFYLIHQEQKRKDNPRQKILQSIYVFMGLNFLVAVLVSVSTFLSKPDLTKELAESEGMINKYKIALTSLAANVNGKVRYEMKEIENGNIRSPAMSTYIEILNETIDKAKEDGLIDD